MAADSFPFLWEAICRDLRPYRDGLITLGALYGIKLTWTGIRALTKTLYVYGASRIWPWTREDWSHRYGTWAGNQ